MKKVLCIVLMVALLTAVAAGCAQNAPSTSSEAPASSVAPASSAAASSAAPEESEDAAAAGGYEIAMITDVGTIDDKSFNQGTWEGVKAYAEENNITHKYYKPAEKTTDAYIDSIGLAVTGGAKIIVCPGFLFEPAIFVTQDQYPDVKFVLIDGRPQDGTYTTYKTGSNTYSVIYAEEQPGFLAGYAAVKEGFTKLGFMGGMAVPAVVRYGYGFVQGAEYAAQEMGLADGSIEIKYTYVGNFDATPENQTIAASWFQDGTEIIFGCGGGVGISAMAAAEAAGTKMIGVDVDQAAESPTVITSAMKYLKDTVYEALKAYYAGSFPGGMDATLGAKENMVGLPDDFSQFTKFTKADYDKIYAALAADTDKIASDIKKDTDAETAADLGTKAVVVEVIE
jgi:basic membrane protein A